MDPQLEFRVLGPLEILADGQPVRVDAPKQRAILAVLLIHASEVVSTDRLLEAVWGAQAADTGVGTLRYHISKLREALPDDAITTRSPGYCIEIEPEQLDSAWLEHLISEARRAQATDPAMALSLLDDALGLFRGEPLVEFEYEDFARLEVERLVELRRSAVEDRIDALLETGKHAESVTELEALTKAHPTRERLWGQLALALYRGGRQADAVATFSRIRAQLGEVGLDLSPQLRELEDRVLTQDPSLLSEETTPERLRGYVVRGRIGEGAHGVVLRAAQPGIGREVAIKAIRPELANEPAFIRRFEAEAQLVASLEHPHIVSLFDFWRDPEGAYLVMPYLRGGSLADRLGKGTFEPEAALRLLEDVGSALAYAHRRGVVHRDVTPHNILLDDEGNPYLADFGVAALLGEASAQYVKDSPSATYLSPELLAGQPGTPESDVFSLGALAAAVLGDGALLAGLVDVVARAMDEKPADRYASVDEFLGALTGAVGAAPAPTATRLELRNPYKGLRAFAEADAPDFFGRDQLVAQLIDVVGRHRLVGVVGPSGCGKSSLVRAGLIPRLRSGALSTSERWLVTDMYPGTNPFAELEAALLRVAVNRPEDLEARLAEGDWAGLVGTLLPQDSELLLLVDQFEELFTVTSEEEDRFRFLDVLARLAADPRHRVRVLVTMRADFYDRPLEYPEFAELFGSGLVSVSVPGRDAMVEAIVGPASAEGLDIDSSLAEAIVSDVAGQPGGLPLLEYSLTELFRLREGNRLTAVGYRRSGGVLGALGTRAEELYQEQPVPGRLAIRQVFLRLVTVAAGADDTRRRIPVTQLQRLGIEDEVLGKVVGSYVDHRLLTLDRDPETRVPTVEVAHEALLDRWDRLRTWIDDRRDDLVLHRRLAASVSEWVEADRQPAYLVSGGRLEHFEEFVGDTDLAITDEEATYLSRSQLHTEQIRVQRRRRRQGILAGFAVAAAIAVVLAVFALSNQRRAEESTAEARANEQLAIEQRDAAQAAEAIAEEQRELAESETRRADAERAEAVREATIRRATELMAESRLALETDPELGILLALESVAIEVDGEPLDEAALALRNAVLSSRLRLTVPGWWRADVDRSGARLVAADDNGPVTVYDIESRNRVVQLPVRRQTQDAPTDLAVAISPDGTRVATGRQDGTIALWDTTTGEELSSTNDQQTLWTNAVSGTFRLFFDDSVTVPIAVDGSGPDIAAALETLADIQDVVVIGEGSPGVPWRVTFVDTDADYVARLGVDSEGLLPASASFEIAGRGHDHPDRTDFGYDGIPDIQFSPDGTRVASRGWDGTVRIWDAATLSEIVRLGAPLPPHKVGGVVFSPDGTLIAGIAYGNPIAVVVWDAATGDRVYELEPDRAEPSDLAFLPSGDGLVVAKYGVEGSALSIWNLSTDVETPVAGRGAWPTSVAVSPDGRLLALGGNRGSIQIKEISEAGVADLFTINAHEHRVQHLQFSEAWRLVSTATSTTRIWDLRTASDLSLLITLPDSPLAVWDIATAELVELAESRLTRTFTAAECERYDIQRCMSDG